MKQKLEFRQKAIFTQSLQQSIKILELSLMELKEAIEVELSENPVVEEVVKEAPLSLSADAPEIKKIEREAPMEDEGSLPFDREVMPGELSGYEKSIPGRKEGLADVLLRQLRINAQNESDVVLGAFLIHSIDENGYIRESLDLLVQEARCSDEDILRVLELIQTFDPPGVGARDLKECLLIQARRFGEPSELLLKLISGHLEDLAAKDVAKLCKKCKCSEEELWAEIKKIQYFEPKPGRSYSTDEAAYVIPDVVVEQKDDCFSIATKDDTLPTIRISAAYKSMLKSKKVAEDTKEFIRQRMANANNLIRAIKQRHETLTKVVSVIVEVQAEAIADGLEHLKPLTLKEIAERVKMHESTISRVVMSKYIQTPQGVFALREFFSGSLKSETGEDVSSQKIKLKIKELVEQEDKMSPLRDQELARLIQETENTHIARRTVVKYRESLNIPSVAKRRLKGVLVHN